MYSTTRQRYIYILVKTGYLRAMMAAACFELQILSCRTGLQPIGLSTISTGKHLHWHLLHCFALPSYKGMHVQLLHLLPWIPWCWGTKTIGDLRYHLICTQFPLVPVTASLESSIVSPFLRNLDICLPSFPLSLSPRTHIPKWI